MDFVLGVWAVGFVITWAAMRKKKKFAPDSELFLAIFWPLLWVWLAFERLTR